jgi:hypothetical protein
VALKARISTRFIPKVSEETDSSDSRLQYFQSVQQNPLLEMPKFQGSTSTHDIQRGVVIPIVGEFYVMLRGM